ncbi:MAG: AtzE family amidohydrolase [Nocardioidaceae bacterium]
MTSVPTGAATSAVALASRVRSGQLSAVETVSAALAAIADRDGEINSVTDTYPQRSIEEARRVDAAVAAGAELGPLAGVPFVVKNLFDVAGSRTRAGSVIELDRPAASADATAVRRMREAGAVVVASTNMDEYAHGFTTENAHDGTTRNPRDLQRIAGGSSGGSAAAVARGIVPLALGSDTNGSIRVPASLCGTFGLKPTYGRVSRAGSTLFATSLDHVGPLAATVADLAAAYDAVAGFDPADPVSSKHPCQPCTPVLEQDADGLRVALAGGHFEDVADDDAREALARAARSLGVDRQVEVDLSRQACAAASVITSAEAGQRHLRQLQTRADDYDPAVRPALIAGALLPAADYLAAQRLRAAYRAVTHALFEDTDVLLTATTPCCAPLVGQRTMQVQGEALLVGMSLGLLTQPWSLVGLPALTVPLTGRGGLPIGVQLVAAPFREASLFRVAAALERSGLTIPLGALCA